MTGEWRNDAHKVRWFQRHLLRWYEVDHRDLPWRADRDPYRVWISEIMLQQTRVAAVLEHYRKFLRRFPTVEDLAGARESSVLAAWSGLGYYRRARMLHAAAKQIVREHAGKLPTTAAGWRELPGIGRYTAAAIASIAFGEAAAVVDGNVERVIERILGERVSKDKAWAIAEQLVCRTHSGDFNQAMMELGAMVCLPKQPACGHCPVWKLCSTRGTLVDRDREPRARREVHYAIDVRNDSVLLVRRPKAASLMPSMWELPEVQANGAHSFTLRHSITITDFRVKVSYCSAPPQPNGKWVRKNRVSSLPLTGLARKILTRAQVIPSVLARSSGGPRSSKLGRR